MTRPFALWTWLPLPPLLAASTIHACIVTMKLGFQRKINLSRWQTIPPPWTGMEDDTRKIISGYLRERKEKVSERMFQN